MAGWKCCTLWCAWLSCHSGWQPGSFAAWHAYSGLCISHACVLDTFSGTSCEPSPLLREFWTDCSFGSIDRNLLCAHLNRYVGHCRKGNLPHPSSSLHVHHLGLAGQQQSMSRRCPIRFCSRAHRQFPGFQDILSFVIFRGGTDFYQLLRGIA